MQGYLTVIPKFYTFQYIILQAWLKVDQKMYKWADISNKVDLYCVYR